MHRTELFEISLSLQRDKAVRDYDSIIWKQPENVRKNYMYVLDRRLVYSMDSNFKHTPSSKDSYINMVDN